MSGPSLRESPDRARNNFPKCPLHLIEKTSGAPLRHLRKQSPVVPTIDKQMGKLDPRFHLAAIVDSSGDPIISMDLDGNVISWNRAAERVFGYTAGEMIGNPMLKLAPPELHREEESNIQKIQSGERIEQVETFRLRKNGERFPAIVTISPVYEQAGRVVGASVITRETSDRKRDEVNRLRLAAIVESADDAIISKDLNGTVMSWNHAACRMFGYSEDEMIGTSIRRLIPANLQFEEDEILRRLRAGDRIDHYETKRLRKDGSLIEVSVTISPIKDSSGNVKGASKIARDISDRRRMEELLVQSEKLAATGRMAAAIAHEINNPLEALINLIFLAREETPESSRAYQHLVTAEEELERLSHLARQTLGYYRDTGRPSDLVLHGLIENVLTIYKSKMISVGISVDARFNDLQKITANRGELIQVFSNLIDNAIDSMSSGGSLLISTRTLMSATGDGIQIAIQDTGTGISQENLPKVFEPFFTTKGDLETGIGLWVTKQLIEKRGGQISISSTTEPGKSGTTVTVFIPFSFSPTNSRTENQ